MFSADADFINQAPCGIFSFTEEGLITNANKYCCDLLGYELSEIAGKNIADLLTLSGRIFYQTHLYPLVKLHGHTEEIFLTLTTKSKTHLPVVLNATISNQSNRLTIICSFIQVLNRRKYEDEILTAKKNAEEALRKHEVLEQVKKELQAKQKELDKQITLLSFQNKELIQLGNVVTHDLQEPVRKLLLFSNELMDVERLDEGKKAAAVKIISRSAFRIKKLLFNLQQYLSLTVDESERTTIDLERVIKRELEQLQQIYPQTNTVYHLDSLPQIVGIEKQIQLLFFHILKNAFDHGTKDNCLHLTISGVIVKENQFNYNKDKYHYINFVKISIADKGKGFDNHYKDYIFEVLKKLEVSDLAGFGLAFCKRIIENHLGSITAYGETGNGATFILMLPLPEVQ